MSANEIRKYPSDEGYMDEEAPVLSVFFGGNLDWYLAIEFTDHNNRHSKETMRRTVAVRVTTSGQRVPGITKAVHDIWKALEDDRATEVLGEEWLKWSMEKR